MSQLSKKLIMKNFLLFASLICTYSIAAQDKGVLADILIKNTTVVDVINKQLLLNRDIVINDGYISEIIVTSKQSTAKKVIDGTSYISIPGFINTHTHLWQHISKSTYPEESLQNWVKVYNPIHCLEPQELYNVVLAASNEALLSGITSVSDYASLSFNDYGFRTNAKAISDAGLGGVLVYNNPSVFIPDYIKLQEIPRLQKEYQNRFNIWMGYGPLSFYSIPQVYSGIAIGKKLSMNFTEHTMENNQEQRDFYDSTQKYLETFKDKLANADKQFIEKLLKCRRPSDVDAYEQLLRLNKQIIESDSILIAKQDKEYMPLTDGEKKTILNQKNSRIISPLLLLDYLGGLKDFLSIHSVWPQSEDLKIMIANNISVSHNPESNLYLTSGIAPINDYLNSNTNITLGTDGAASNDGINMFSAMREMWNVHKIKLMNTEIARQLTDWDILQSATINGAKALKIDKFTGSIDIGKEADITLVATNELGMSPIRNNKLISLLIYSGNARNVKYVISDGKVLVEDGHLVNFSETDLANNLSKIASDVDNRVTKGKIWDTNYNIDDKILKSYWYQYRSVRKPDNVNLIVKNSISKKIKVSIIASGSVFGGGTPNVIDKEFSNRFPEDANPKSFKEEVILNPNESLNITKGSGDYIYNIKTSTGNISHEARSGQLLLLVEKQ